MQALVFFVFPHLCNCLSVGQLEAEHDSVSAVHHYPHLVIRWWYGGPPYSRLISMTVTMSWSCSKGGESQQQGHLRWVGHMFTFDSFRYWGAYKPSVPTHTFLLHTCGSTDHELLYMWLLYCKEMMKWSNALWLNWIALNDAQIVKKNPFNFMALHERTGLQVYMLGLGRSDFSKNVVPLTQYRSISEFKNVLIVLKRPNEQCSIIASLNQMKASAFLFIFDLFECEVTL